MTDERRPAAVCIAAGAQQLPVIRAAGSLGLAVVGVDRDPEAVGFEACEERVLASTHDPSAVLRRLEPLAERYDFRSVLVRSAGPPVVTAAVVSETLGIPGVSPEAAHQIVDKERLLAACAEAGIPAPSVRSAAKLEDLESPGAPIPPLPCIVKPALGMVGKQAIRMVRAESELAEAFAASRAVSATGRVNVEEWVPGFDCGLVSVVRGGVLHPITLIDEWNEIDGDGAVLPRGVSSPSRFSGQPEEGRVLALARRLVSHFALDTTAFMMACRVLPGGEPVLTEIHLDLGGDRILDDLLPASSSCDVLGHVVGLLCEAPGEPPSEKPLGAFRPAAIRFGADAPETPGGRTARVLIADDAPSLELAMGRL